MDIKTLYRDVSLAIRQAESYQDQNDPRAGPAFRSVSELEDQIAELLAAGTPEGAVARRGAIRAAVAAGDPQRATHLLARYSAEPDCDDQLRSELQEIVAFSTHRTSFSDAEGAAGRVSPDALPILIIGAGASRMMPTSLPTAPELTYAALRALGWSVDPESGGGGSMSVRWRRHGIRGNFPPVFLPTSGAPAELLLGVLTLIGIPVEQTLANLMLGAPPNLAHKAAASLLGAGGSVWTTNFDCAIEAAFQEASASTHQLRRYFPAMPGTDADGSPTAELPEGTLVKLHGSLDEPRTIQFSMPELMGPLPDGDLQRLRLTAKDRTFIVFGYSGSDYDLQHALRECMIVSRAVLWFEPSSIVRRRIQRDFGDCPIQFFPEDADDPSFSGTWGAFVSQLESYGFGPFQANPPAFSPSRFAEVRLPNRPLPASVHARLVERFGRRGDEQKAFWLALLEDLIRFRIAEFPFYIRWSIRHSLLRGGLVWKVARLYLRYPMLLRIPATDAIRNGALNTVSILGPEQLGWDRINALTEAAVSLRRTPEGHPYPSDLYNRTRVLRSQFRVSEARISAAEAEASVSKVRGRSLSAAITFEAALLDLYQGRFEEAEERAQQLQRSDSAQFGRRWAAWGFLIQSFGHSYLGEVKLARLSAKTSAEYFESYLEQSPFERTGIVDCKLAEMFADRVALALGEADVLVHPEIEIEASLSRRQTDDFRLIMAERSLAMSDIDGAEHWLDMVTQSPYGPASQAWADLGLAEVRRLRGDRNPGFERIRERAQGCGASWLEVQAVVGLYVAGQLPGTDAYREILQLAPQIGITRNIDDFILGSPRVLWMIT